MKIVLGTILVMTGIFTMIMGVLAMKGVIELAYAMISLSVCVLLMCVNLCVMLLSSSKKS